jgi:hypothetical protein
MVSVLILTPYSYHWKLAEHHPWRETLQLVKVVSEGWKALLVPWGTGEAPHPNFPAPPSGPSALPSPPVLCLPAEVHHGCNDGRRPCGPAKLSLSESNTTYLLQSLWWLQEVILILKPPSRCRRVNMLQILHTHGWKWKNETCWKYSRNGGWRGIKKNDEGGEFNGHIFDILKRLL